MVGAKTKADRSNKQDSSSARRTQRIVFSAKKRRRPHIMQRHSSFFGAVALLFWMYRLADAEKARREC